MKPPPERYSDRPLPSYRFVPGRRPHPTRSPLGHSYGEPEPVGDLDPDRWRDCEPLLYAVDLFNRRYYWEAHEALEPLWQHAGRDSPTGRFLQGIIKVSAALLKHAMGNASGADRHAAAGGALLRTANGPLLGIDGRQLAEDVDAFVAGETDQPPSIVLQP